MPFGGNFHISKVLSNLAINYKNADFIADQAFPSIPVQKESDLYYIYVRDFRVENTYRANKSPANMVSWGISTAAYYLDEHALADIVTDRDRSNSDLGTIEQDTVEFLTSKILVRKEKAVADLVFTTGSWGLYASGSTSTSWNYNTTTSAPIQNVLSGTMAIVKNSGVSPNTMILGMNIFHSLKENPNVYGRVQYVERSIIGEDLLAAVFEVGKVLVGKAVYDSAVDGATESLTAIWGSNALLAHLNPAGGMKKLTAAGILEIGGKYKVKKWRVEELSGDAIEVSTMYVPKLVATNCAYYFSAFATT